MQSPDLQALIDSAFEIEIQRVSTLEFNSNEICRHFYGELRKRILATAPTLPGAGGGDRWVSIASLIPEGDGPVVVYAASTEQMTIIPASAVRIGCAHAAADGDESYWTHWKDTPDAPLAALPPQQGG